MLKNMYLFKDSLRKSRNKIINSMCIHLPCFHVLTKNIDITQSKNKIQNRIAILSVEFSTTLRRAFLKILTFKET